MKLFVSEKDAIKWVQQNISIAVKPKRKSKTKLVYAFSSYCAHDQVAENLGKDLYKYQQEKQRQ